MDIRTRTGSFVFVLSTGSLASLSGRASEPPLDGASPRPQFGEAGQLAIAGAGQVSLEHSSFPGPNTSFALAPSADLFPFRNLSFGARVSYAHQAFQGEASFDTIAVSPRIGYNFALSEHFSFWPTVSVTYSESVGGGASARGISIGGYAPLLYHPAPHFFFGLGPNFSSEVMSVDSTPQGEYSEPLFTQYGLMLTAGGWVKL